MSSRLRLDVPREDALQRATEIVNEGWRSFDTARADEPPIDDHLRQLLQADLPELPTGVLEVLEDARRGLDESIAQTRPRFFAFVASSGLEIGVIGDLVGFLVGLAICLNIESIRQFMSWLTNTELFSPELYFLSRLPADLDVGE